MITAAIKRFKERLRVILHLDETPHLLAKSFAAGVFVAFSPIIGLHTAAVLLIAWVFRLNKFVALTGTFINNPWTIALVYVAPTWVAVVTMRRMGIDMPPFHYDMIEAEFLQTMELYKMWQPIFWKTFAQEFKPYLDAFIIGTTTAGAFAALISYVIVYYGITYQRRRKAVRKAQA